MPAVLNLFPKKKCPLEHWFIFKEKREKAGDGEHNFMLECLAKKMQQRPKNWKEEAYHDHMVEAVEHKKASVEEQKSELAACREVVQVKKAE